MKTTACLQCHKTFRYSEHNTSGKYCSYDCYWQSKKGKKELAKNFGEYKVWNKGIKINRQTHPNFGNYKGGITTQDKKDRKLFSTTVTPLVFARDDYTCTVCDVRGGLLHADHIKSWKDYPELRLDLNNCRTVCRACHYYITFKRIMPENSKWGYRKRTATT